MNEGADQDQHEKPQQLASFESIERKEEKPQRE